MRTIEVEQLKCLTIEAPVAGEVLSSDEEGSSPLQAEQPSPTAELIRRADEKRAQLRRPEYDPPCRVADGLYIGGVGAARDLAALQVLGITHVVNASPIVPCFHRKKLRYRAVSIYDDEEEDIQCFFESTSRFIARGRRKGGVLVHCYAGQSRSSTLVVAYLLSCERLQLTAAMQLLSAARPCACPNAGFLRQLESFAASILIAAPASDQLAASMSEDEA